MTINIRKILCPIDFSQHADLVVEWAIHLAEEHSAEVLLLHAYHLPVEFQQLEGAYLPADFWDSVKQEAERSLAAYGERIRAKGVPVEEIVREGTLTLRLVEKNMLLATAGNEVFVNMPVYRLSQRLK